MKIKISLLILLILFSLSGCKKFLDINNDPDAIENVPLSMLLPAALSSPMYVIGADGQIIGSFWAQHWTQSTNAPQYQGYDSWQMTNATFDGYGYGSLYFNALKDLEYIKNKSHEEENWTYYLIATSVQCYVFQILVDLYDEIPFSEALKGDEGGENAFTPHFEKGAAIYDSLIVRLDYALSKDLTVSTCENPGTQDIVFQGDMNSWVAFANTLKLKIYLRQSYARPDVASSGIASLADAQFLTSANASFNIFLNQSNKQNPIYAIAEIAHKGNLTISRTLMSWMIDDLTEDTYKIRDKRIDYIAEYPAKVPEYHRALFQGDYSNIEYASDIQYLSRPKLNFDDHLYYFTTAEVWFMLAEADLIYWKTGNAQTYYENGVTAAFKRFNYLANYDSENEQADIDDILDEADYGQWPITEEDQLNIIWLQKWISMANIQGLEAFLEHNRTDYPVVYPIRPGSLDFEDEYNYSDDRGKFTIAVNNVTSDRFPHRFMCPQSEIDGNPNTPTEQKEKKVYDIVWWDVEH